MLLSKALAMGDELVPGRRDHPATLRVALAGSARRRVDAVKDLDIVAAARDPKALVDHFCSLAALDVVKSSGTVGASRTHSGLPVDLRIVPEEAFCSLSSTSRGRASTTRRCAAPRSSAACT